MRGEIKRAIDHLIFEGKSNIAVIYRRESLWVGQWLPTSSVIAPVNTARLRRASLPSSGESASPSCQAAAFLAAFFSLCNAK